MSSYKSEPRPVMIISIDLLSSEGMRQEVLWHRAYEDPIIVQENVRHPFHTTPSVSCQYFIAAAPQDMTLEPLANSSS